MIDGVKLVLNWGGKIQCF